MRRWSALLVGDALRLRAAHRVVVCAGGQAAVEADFPTALARVNERPVTWALVDLAALGEHAVERLRDLHHTAPQMQLVLLAAPSPPPCLPELLLEPWFRHLEALESPWFMEELGATLRKSEQGPGLGTGQGLGLACYLPWGAEIREVPLACSDDKAGALSHLAAFMASLGIGGRMMRRLQDIADEMVMNAIYDAPVDALGHPKYAHLSRQTPVALEPREHAVLSFGSDGRTMGLAVRDPFGALPVETLKRYIAKGLRRGADQMDQKAGGAGLGLFLQFDFLGSMCLNLVPGRATEVIGLVDIRGSFKDLATAPKSFNCFEGPVL